MFFTSKNMLLKWLFAILAYLYAGQASAMGLMEAYEAALANDSVYRSAMHENEAGQQYKEIGRANLLPSVSASYAYSKNYGDIASKTNLGWNTQDRDYNSKNATIQLRQPLINMDGLARYKQGNAQTMLSDKQFEVRKQELMARFFGLYASANFSEDVLALAEKQRDAFMQQLQSNTRMSKFGEGTKTDLIESQAKLSLSEAQVIEAEYNVIDSHNALAAMLGKEVNTLDALSESFEVLPLAPSAFDEWKALALKNNAEIAAQSEAIEIANQEVKRNRAGHMPRLDAIASISNSDSDTSSTFNQKINNKSIGLQLNVPIYSGGSVTALTLQAEANHKKAQDDLESKTNEVVLGLRKQYSAVLSNILKVEALKKSVASAELLIEATQKSVAGGIRTNLDVLNARKQLFEVKRDLSSARYNYLVAYIGLRKAAGVLTANDFEKISSYFVKQAKAEN